MAKKEKEIDNSIYIQLQRDLKKKKYKNRIYIPIGLFGDSEYINVTPEYVNSNHFSMKQKVLSIVSAIIN